MVNGYSDIRDERLVPLFEATREWFEDASWEMPNGVFGDPVSMSPDAITFRGIQSFETARRTQAVYDRHCRAVDLQTGKDEPPLDATVVSSVTDANRMAERTMWTNDFEPTTDYRNISEVDGDRRIGNRIEVYCRVPFASTVTTLPKLWLEVRRLYGNTLPFDIERIARETENVMGEINI